MAHPAVRKVVFPAAGLGTRFLPASKAMPKEMLTLVDRPVIQYGIEEAVAAGLDEVVLVTSRGKSVMEDHFDASPELEAELERRGKDEALEMIRRLAATARISSVRQPRALGLGHAVAMTQPIVGDEPFAVILSDDVIKSEVPCIRQLLDVYDEHGASVICIEPVEPQMTASYGIIAGEQVGDRLYRVTDLVEKPSPEDAPSNLGIIGRYVLTPRIYEKLASTERGAGNEIQLTDAIRMLLEDEPVYAYAFEGSRYDAGSKLGFLKATVELALARQDLGKPFAEYLETLKR